MKVNVNVELDGVLFEREANWPAVPTEGDIVELEPGGWNEPVYRVWFMAHDGAVTVELGMKKDVHDEDLALALRKAGWSSR